MLDLYYKIFRRGRRTDYQRVYSWYEEKRDECEQLRGELAKAAGEILGLKNELHTREVVNQTFPYCVMPSFMVSNHTRLDLMVQTVKDGIPQAHVVAPYTRQAFSPADHTEISVVEKVNNE